MAHIRVSEPFPGILGLLKAYPETAKHLNGLAEALLTKPTPSFSKAERETVASYVSFLNGCQFCSLSHGAVADVLWGKDGFAEQIWRSPEQAPISDCLKALLAIAAKVQKTGREVQKADVEKAMACGASEADVHDTVLIAAAFCLYNRYVDGLGTMAPPPGHSSYKEIGKMLAAKGYLGAG